MNNDIKQVAYNKSFIVFGLPLINTNFDELVTKISKLKYKIKCIQFRNYNNKNVSQYLEFNLLYTKNEINNKIMIKQTNYETNKPSVIQKQEQNNNPISTFKSVTKRENLAVFKVKPDVQNDIYYLYSYDDNTNDFVYFNIAYIPDFKTSVMMNKLFRNIKENNNLDALEESDDDEEFENEKEDRFVYLNREFNMVCSFNYKFKKWTPLRISDKPFL
jgi:hypothetical protein